MTRTAAAADPPTTRDRILAGAQAALVDNGIAGTTVADVLASAGVSRRTFYQYFRSKDDVVRALYERHAEQLVAAVAAAVAGVEDDRDKVVRALDVYLDFQRLGGRLRALLQAEAIRPESALAPRRRATLDALVAVVAQGVEDNLGVRTDPWVFRALLVGIEGLVIELVTRPGTVDGPSEADLRRIRRVGGAILLNVLAGAQYLPTPWDPTRG